MGTENLPSTPVEVATACAGPVETSPPTGVSFAVTVTVTPGSLAGPAATTPLRLHAEAAAAGCCDNPPWPGDSAINPGMAIGRRSSIASGTRERRADQATLQGERVG